MTQGSTFIIAEAGVNHNGSLAMAMELVDAAANFGADAIKFQTFKSNALTTAATKKADYQLPSTNGDENQLSMLKALEFSEEQFVELYNYCGKRKVDFLSTPFDIGSLNFLVDRLRLKTLKIPSGEITNAPLLLSFARKAERLILSTGMSTLKEVSEALAVLVWGVEFASVRLPKSFSEVWDYFSIVGTKPLQGRVTILQCTSEYPAPFSEVNLKAMDTMTSEFSLPVGFSDHTVGILASVAAVARGASLVEKHFTLDRGLSGPDHAASLEPKEMQELIQAIREVEVMVGNGVKIPSSSELKNIDKVRKSIVASNDIQIGDTLNEDNLTFKRPGNGVSPMQFWDLNGSLSEAIVGVDEQI